MKKVACLLLVLVLVCSMGASALASVKFDTSVFQGVPNIVVNYDDMDDSGFIIMSDISPCNFDPGYSKYKYCSMYPVIIYTDKYVVFNLLITFYSDEWAWNDSMIVKIGDKRYTFSGISHDSEVVEHAEVCEDLLVIIGPDSFAFMEDLVAHKDEEIKVRLVGDEYNTDFVMPDGMKDVIATFYQLFVKAGGTLDESTYTAGIMESDMTVK